MVYVKGGETYPDYVFDDKDPVPLKNVVSEQNGLPLSSRSTEEIELDIQTEFSFIISAKRSIIRRKPRRYQSELVVAYLDSLDGAFQRIGGIAINHVHLLAALEQKG
jgi:hypothetical protein